MNMTLNNAVEMQMTETDKGRLAAGYVLLLVVPAIVEQLLRAAITPGDSDYDWDDPEHLAKQLAAKQLEFLLGLVAGGREFSNAAGPLFGERSFGYQGPAGMRIFSDTYKLVEQVGQAEFADAFRKAAINAGGAYFGLPSAQANRMITGGKALAEGETVNPFALMFGYQKKR